MLVSHRFPTFALMGVLGLVAGLVPATRAEDKKADDGWVQLFNGKDLTGWKIPDPPSGGFKKGVKEGEQPDAAAQQSVSPAPPAQPAQPAQSKKE